MYIFTICIYSSPMGSLNNHDKKASPHLSHLFITPFPPRSHLLSFRSLYANHLPWTTSHWYHHTKSRGFHRRAPTRSAVSAWRGAWNLSLQIFLKGGKDDHHPSHACYLKNPPGLPRSLHDLPWRWRFAIYLHVRNPSPKSHGKSQGI